MKPRVVLVGLPGAGKTTIGRRLSRALGVDVVDSDHLIEQRFDNKPCGEIFDELGEEKFRLVEEEAVQEALETDGVVSLGGGAVLSVLTRSRLADCEVVFLDVTAEEGFRRTSKSLTRPVLNSENPAQRYADLDAQRRPLYEEVATLRVRSDQRGPHKVVTTILNHLETSQACESSIPDAELATCSAVEEFL